MWEVSDKHETALEDSPPKNTELFLYSENTRVDSFQMGTNTVFIFSRARGEHTERNRKQRDECSGTDSSL